MHDSSEAPARHVARFRSLFPVAVTIPLPVFGGEFFLVGSQVIHEATIGFWRRRMIVRVFQNPLDDYSSFPFSKYRRERFSKPHRIIRDIFQRESIATPQDVEKHLRNIVTGALEPHHD